MFSQERGSSLARSYREYEKILVQDLCRGEVICSVPFVRCVGRLRIKGAFEGRPSGHTNQSSLRIYGYHRLKRSTEEKICRHEWQRTENA